MAETSVTESIEINEEEHSLGELSSAHLDAATAQFKSDGIVAWQNLWRDHAVNLETLRRLSSFPAEKNFIYVRAGNLLPREITGNKFLNAFLAAQFPNARVLQIYARHATTTGTLTLRSTDAVAPLLVQVIVAHQENPLSMTIECGGHCIRLNGKGLAIVRNRSTEVSVHVNSRDYTVVTLDYDLPTQT